MDSLWHVKDRTQTIADVTWMRHDVESPDGVRVFAMAYDPIRCHAPSYAEKLVAAHEIAQHIARLPRLQAAAQRAITAIDEHGLTGLIGDVRNELLAALDGTPPPRRSSSNGLTLGHADMPHSEAILSQGGACP